MRELLVVNSTLGELIRAAREDKGLSRTKLAEFADITPNSMVRYEKAGTPDGKYPSALKLVKICEVLEIDPRNAFDAIKNESYLADLEDNPVPEGKVPSVERFGLRFSNHFRTDDDWLNWKLSVKDVEELNASLDLHQYAFHNIDQRLERIEEHEGALQNFLNSPEYKALFAKTAEETDQLRELEFQKQNGPDQNDPSRSDNTLNNPEAVGAASTNQPEGKD